MRTCGKNKNNADRQSEGRGGKIQGPVAQRSTEPDQTPSQSKAKWELFKVYVV